jgi:hypothetical protein
MVKGSAIWLERGTHFPKCNCQSKLEVSQFSNAGKSSEDLGKISKNYNVTELLLSSHSKNSFKRTEFTQVKVNFKLRLRCIFETIRTQVYQIKKQLAPNVNMKLPQTFTIIAILRSLLDSLYHLHKATEHITVDFNLTISVQTAAQLVKFALTL